MQTTAQFFQDAKKAGMTVLASWAPSGGGGPFAADVIYRGPSTVVGADGGVRVVDHSITFPAALLPGLKEGELIVVDGANYRVRTKPELELDGTRARAELARFVP